jgi:hypothetical protein
MEKLIDYLEVVKFLNRDTYSSNPPKFLELLEKFESHNPAFNKDDFLAEGKNASIYLSYIFTKFNWVMFKVASNDPDLAELINLVSQLETVKGKFSNPMTNFYVNTMYVMLSSVSLYFCDKSNESLAQFNRSIAEIIHTASTFWLTDYNAEYMESKTPQIILDKPIKTPQCNSSCGDCTCNDSSIAKRKPTSEVSSA